MSFLFGVFSQKKEDKKNGAPEEKKQVPPEAKSQIMASAPKLSAPASTQEGKEADSEAGVEASQYQPPKLFQGLNLKIGARPLQRIAKPVPEPQPASTEIYVPPQPKLIPPKITGGTKGAEFSFIKKEKRNAETASVTSTKEDQPNGTNEDGHPEMLDRQESKDHDSGSDKITDENVRDTVLITIPPKKKDLESEIPPEDRPQPQAIAQPEEKRRVGIPIKDIAREPAIVREKEEDKKIEKPPTQLIPSLPVAEPPSQSVVTSIKVLIDEQIRTDPVRVSEILLSKLSLFDKSFLNLQIEQQSLLIKKNDKQKDLEKRKLERETLGNLLAEIIKEERYSEADNIQQRINGILEAENKISKEVEAIQESLNLSEFRKLDAKKKKTEIVKYASEKATKWVESEKISLNEYSECEAKKISDGQKSIEAEKESLTLLNKKIVEDKGIYDTKNKEFDETIQTVCEKWIKAREKLDTEINVIDQEIDELKKKIQEKEKEREGKAGEKKQIVDEIQGIKASYKDREAEIQALKNEVTSNEAQSAERISIIKSKEEGLQNEQQNMENTMKKRKSTLEQVTEQTKKNILDYDRMSEEISTRETLRENARTFKSNLYDLRLKINNMQTRKDCYLDKVAKSDSQIAEFTAKVVSSKVVLGKLEEEKKGYAAAKKFKEASKVSADLKALHVKLEKEEADIETIKKQKEEWVKEVEETEKAVAALKASESSIEESMNKSLFMEGIEKIAELEWLGKIVDSMEDRASDRTTLEQQLSVLKEEQKTMKTKWPYLEECEQKALSAEEAIKMYESLKTEEKALESEVEAHSAKEEYEEADKKQTLLTELQRKIKRLAKLHGISVAVPSDPPKTSEAAPPSEEKREDGK